MSLVREQVERERESEGSSEEGCLGCLRIEVSSVILSNGLVVCTSCPAYRRDVMVQSLSDYRKAAE